MAVIEVVMAVTMKMAVFGDMTSLKTVNLHVCHFACYMITYFLASI
jgi:hypothetical protein